jgi:hypothetical protein
MPKLAEPTVSANRIAEGLMRSGRAVCWTAMREFGFICLRSATNGFYWVANDGKRMLRGENFNDAESLQAGFISKMERAGGGGRYHLKSNRDNQAHPEDPRSPENRP